ncbi:MAG TPA: RNA methyltransferase [Chitinophagales bacterium]|nr:RNA methyltransferase [Chitinophagales bacterium]
MLTKAEIKHLQSLKLKKYRQNYDEFIIEGEKLTTEALLGNAEMLLLIANAGWIKEHKSTIPANIPLHEVSENDLEKISSLSTAPPVMALVKQKKVSIHQFENTNNWIIALDGINDPGNMGTILRTADWFGIDKVICSDDCVDLYNPKVVQSTMGAIFRVDVLYTGLETFLKDNKMPVYGAVLEGENIYQTKFKQPGILVIGSESHGIRKEVLNYCSNQITIPRFGKSESLNAGVAAGIILSEIRR